MSNITALPAPSWAKDLQRYSSGALHGTLANVCAMLRGAPDLQTMLAYDEFAGKTMLVSAPPWSFEPQTFYQRPWTAHDDLLATEHVQIAGIPVKVQTTAQAVELVARERPYHPVLDYLDSLEWDGVCRLDRLFPQYFGANDDVYTASIGRHFMIGAVARVTNPGIKHDHMPIVEGAQGIGKSRAFKILFDPWFSDEIGDLGSKDAAMQMQGVWCIEISELDAYSRAETGRIKAWTSRTVDRFRPPYGSRVIESPRPCVFAGTTNGDSYLKDETGNRRFWPVRASRVEIQALEKDRDQLWAEARRLHSAGAAWWLLNREAVDQAKQEQLARLTDDPWDGLISAYVEPLTDVAIADILAEAIYLDRSRWGQVEQNRIARCLKARGWNRVQVRTGDKRAWRYKRGAATQ
jgi:predicted P-loop ATPase